MLLRWVGIGRSGVAANGALSDGSVGDRSVIPHAFLVEPQMPARPAAQEMVKSVSPLTLPLS